jgi:hypothetical protein
VLEVERFLMVDFASTQGRPRVRPPSPTVREARLRSLLSSPQKHHHHPTLIG